MPAYRVVFDVTVEADTPEDALLNVWHKMQHDPTYPRFAVRNAGTLRQRVLLDSTPRMVIETRRYHGRAESKDYAET